MCAVKGAIIGGLGLRINCPQKGTSRSGADLTCIFRSQAGQDGTFNLGFRTRLYFKNPGFKKGDEIVITVKDDKNPELTGSCAVKFE